MDSQSLKKMALNPYPKDSGLSYSISAKEAYYLGFEIGFDFGGVEIVEVDSPALLVDHS